MLTVLGMRRDTGVRDVAPEFLASNRLDFLLVAPNVNTNQPIIDGGCAGTGSG